MHPESGKIYPIDSEEMRAEMKRCGFVEIQKDQEARVMGMNRHERRAWAAQQRRKERAGA